MSYGMSTNSISLLGTSRGYEMLYFGVNLILMIDYRLAFDIIPAESNYEVEVLIVSRRDVDKWKVSHSPSDIRYILL